MLYIAYFPAHRKSAQVISDERTLEDESTPLVRSSPKGRSTATSEWRLASGLAAATLLYLYVSSTRVLPDAAKIHLTLR